MTDSEQAKHASGEYAAGEVGEVRCPLCLGGRKGEACATCRSTGKVSRATFAACHERGWK